MMVGFTKLVSLAMTTTFIGLSSQVREEFILRYIYVFE